MDTREVLKKSELFSELDEKQLNIIYAMSMSQEVDPGVEVCKQGKSEDYVYVIEDGLVSIILEVGPITHRQVQSASTLESFGWSAMVEPHISTATVKAKEKTKLLSFSGEQLYNLFVTHPEIGYKVSKALASVVAKRLRQAYIQLLGVTAQE